MVFQLLKSEHVIRETQKELQEWKERVEKADEQAEYRRKKYEMSLTKNKELQNDIASYKKEIDELQQHASQVEYSTKEKRKLLERQSTMFEVINKKEEQLKEKNQLIEQFQFQNKKKDRVLIAYQEQLQALIGNNGKGHTAPAKHVRRCIIQKRRPGSLGKNSSKFNKDMERTVDSPSHQQVTNKIKNRGAREHSLSFKLNRATVDKKRRRDFNGTFRRRPGRITKGNRLRRAGRDSRRIDGDCARKRSSTKTTIIW